MTALTPKACKTIVDAFELPANQAEALVRAFEKSPTLTNMLNMFVSAGDVLHYEPSSMGMFASGSIATKNAVITFGKDLRLSGAVDKERAFAAATLLARELGRAVTPGGRADWSGVRTPAAAAKVALHAEGVALTQEYIAAAELNAALGTNYAMHSGVEIHSKIARATAGDPAGCAQFIAHAVEAGAKWIAGQIPLAVRCDPAECK
jgi:hypothetical protein